MWPGVTGVTGTGKVGVIGDVMVMTSVSCLLADDFVFCFKKLMIGDDGLYVLYVRMRMRVFRISNQSKGCVQVNRLSRE